MMKKCVIISDSFKGTLSSLEICEIAKDCVEEILPSWECLCIPVADGGEGTVACFEKAIGAHPVWLEVTGPTGQLVKAKYARKDSLAIIEMAQSSGLPLMKDHLDPLHATTYGAGELIRHAVLNGCNHLYLGLGGSATNDGGCGCAAALGADFYDEEGNSFVPDGASMRQIAKVDVSKLRQFLKDVQITVMSDVENPLYGEKGAAHVFAPQKGADPETVEILDQNLRAYADILKRELGMDVAQLPGAGAAGGMGAGCLAFLQAELRSGIEAVLSAVEFDSLVEGADLVISGEGRVDSQSADGKVISGIAKHTHAKKIPLVIVAGSLEGDLSPLYEMGVTAMFSINRKPMDFKESAPLSAENYRESLKDVLRLWASK